jgi:hypothetical protein
MGNDDLRSRVGDALRRRQASRHAAQQRRQAREEQSPGARLVGLQRAQAWALRHFNANPPKGQNTPLDKSSFKVEFEGDEMRVRPQLYRMGLGPWIKYKYSSGLFGGLWIGKNPLTGRTMPWLTVTGEFYQEDLDTGLSDDSASS